MGTFCLNSQSTSIAAQCEDDGIYTKYKFMELQRFANEKVIPIYILSFVGHENFWYWLNGLMIRYSLGTDGTLAVSWTITFLDRISLLL